MQRNGTAWPKGKGNIGNACRAFVVWDVWFGMNMRAGICAGVDNWWEAGNELY